MHKFQKTPFKAGRHKAQKGNIVLILLGAVALIGAVVAFLTNSKGAGDSGAASKAGIKTQASAVLTQGQQISDAMAQLAMNGVDLNEAGVATNADYSDKGALLTALRLDKNSMTEAAASVPDSELWIQLPGTVLPYTNSVGSKSATVFMAIGGGLKKSVCSEIARLTTGSAEIPEGNPVGREEATVTSVMAAPVGCYSVSGIYYPYAVGHVEPVTP